jgi:chromosome segregation ATPase
MRKRMELMERELMQSRERALSSESLLKQQSAMRGEVESQLKEILEQVKAEKQLRELEDEKTLSRGRIDALETRLDEMVKAWTSLVQSALPGHRAAGERADDAAKPLADGLAAMQQAFGGFKQILESMPSLSREVQGLAAALHAQGERRSREEAELKERLDSWAKGIAETLVQRLSALDQRIATELDEQHRRMSTLAHEREALREAMEEQRHQTRQEFLKGRLEIEKQFQAQLAGLQETFGGFEQRHGESTQALSKLRELLGELHARLTQPEKAKDQMIEDLETEKRDLLQALRQRTEQLRTYSLERREVERSLGESLMGFNRQLEAERAKIRGFQEEAASARSAFAGLQAELELLKKEAAQKDLRFQALASERDGIVQALAEEAAKVKTQIEARLESDRRWEEKLLQFQRLLDEERQRRADSEAAVSDLRNQVRSLSDHIGQVVRQKEETERGAGEWLKEREGLLASLRKKDEMISMLSSTFKNLLKKPEA